METLGVMYVKWQQEAWQDLLRAYFNWRVDKFIIDLPIVQADQVYAI